MNWKKTLVATLALIFGVAQATRMSVFVLNLTTLLGLGLGVDYSLLLVSRFREELDYRLEAKRMDRFRAMCDARVRIPAVAAERTTGERFGDFVIRAGYVKSTGTAQDFHEAKAAAPVEA